MEKKLILQNEVAEISKLAIFIDELGEEFGLSPELVFNLNLVLEEAVSNVILYAYPKEEHQTISLIAKKKGNQLIFVLTDSGKEFDPTQAPDADITLSAEERRKEAEISQTISSLAKQMINNADVVLRTDKLVAEGKLTNSHIQKLVYDDGQSV